MANIFIIVIGKIRIVSMNISVILAHPNTNSFNHAITNTTVKTLKENDHNVTYHDLYAERFNPLLLSDEFPQDAYVPNDIRNMAEAPNTAVITAPAQAPVRPKLSQYKGT